MYYVEFPLKETIWNKVVVTGSRPPLVEHEGTDFFVVEYDDRDHFQDELTRFNGVIPYKVVKQNSWNNRRM